MCWKIKKLIKMRIIVRRKSYPRQVGLRHPKFKKKSHNFLYCEKWLFSGSFKLIIYNTRPNSWVRLDFILFCVAFSYFNEKSLFRIFFLHLWCNFVALYCLMADWKSRKKKLYILQLATVLKGISHFASNHLN